MTKERYDHVVIGAGVMGAATAMALADRGRSVLVLERFQIGHSHGSSHGRSRIFRFSYPEEKYVEMAQEALGLWRRAEERASTHLLAMTGGFDVGEGIEENARALEACGAEATLTTGRELRSRFPYMRFEEDLPVLFSPDSGTIAAERSVTTFTELARTGGADVREGARVIAIEDRGSDVEIRTDTDTDTLTAGSVVVTAGGWARDLLQPCGIELPVWVTRETIAYFPLDVKPPTLVDWGDPIVYALHSPGQGLKAGQHVAGPQVDPDEQGEPDRASVGILNGWVAQHFPDAGAAELIETCLYTNTDDQRFILERYGSVVVGSPCSGHGFKFAPLIGERLAGLALET